MTESCFTTLWKDKVLSLLKLRNPDVNEEKAEKILDNILQNRLVNPQGRLVNNYRHITVNTDLLGIADLFYRNKVILGGEGVFYAQHKGTNNPLIRFIAEMMGLRKVYKKKRDTYEKGTDEYLYYDILQLNTKIVINSLYGVLGYRKFHLYNIFLAQSITSMGQNIISSAACVFENFLADNVKFKLPDELYDYILIICNEVRESEDYAKYDSLIPEVSSDMCYIRLIAKCGFEVNEETKVNLLSMLDNLGKKELKAVYFKNNLYEFLALPEINKLIVDVLSRVETLIVPDMNRIEDMEARADMELIMTLLMNYVLYNYPIFDRVRRTKFSITKNVLYIDTDSNFISLAKWIRYSKTVGNNNNLDTSTKDYKFKCVSLMTIILTEVVARALATLCKYCNITPEHAKNLSMKNEFYFSRIIFTTKKKRYSSQMILQEGKILNNGVGFTETKGFDFIKSTTKPTLRKFYEDLLYNEILIADEIKIRNIVGKLMQLKQNITEAAKNGDSTYYKQSSVKLIELYKKPYSVQGVKAVTIWNALAPEYAFELPADVDIIPINLDKKKNLKLFQEKFPERYEYLERFIFNNLDPRVQGLKLDAIAKPRNITETPDWLHFIINADDIVNTALALFNPVLEALDVPLLKVSGNVSHFSNIIPL